MANDVWSHVNLAVLAITQCEESARAGSQGKLLPGVGSDTGVRLPAGSGRRIVACSRGSRFLEGKIVSCSCARITGNPEVNVN